MRSRRGRFLPRTAVLACRSNPSWRARRRPRTFGDVLGGAVRMRRVERSARGPVSATCWMAAAPRRS